MCARARPCDRRWHQDASFAEGLLQPAPASARQGTPQVQCPFTVHRLYTICPDTGQTKVPMQTAHRLHQGKSDDTPRTRLAEEGLDGRRTSNSSATIGSSTPKMTTARSRSAAALCPKMSPARAPAFTSRRTASSISSATNGQCAPSTTAFPHQQLIRVHHGQAQTNDSSSSRATSRDSSASRMQSGGTSATTT